MSTSGRIVILSDLHLSTTGRGAGSAAALRPLWQGAAELILNGDVAEIAHHQLRGPAARQVIHLLQLAEADGVKVTLISGNHDPLLTDRRYLRLANREVFVTHGDILHPAISPWTDHAKALQRFHADAILSLDPAKAREMDHQLAACQHASVQQWDYETLHAHGPAEAEPRRRSIWHHPRLRRVRRHTARATMMVKALYYWYTIPRRAMGFAHRFAPESRFFVFGHIHRAGVWVDRSSDAPHGGRFIINTGAYQTPRDLRAVVIEGRRLEVYRVLYDQAGHRLAPRPLRSFSLRNPAVAATVDRLQDDQPRRAA